MSEVYRYEVHYSKKLWSRGGAWSNLLRQQIPGCPKPHIPDRDIYGHGWHKCHTRNTWGWVYWGFPVDRRQWYCCGCGDPMVNPRGSCPKCTPADFCPCCAGIRGCDLPKYGCPYCRRGAPETLYVPNVLGFTEEGSEVHGVGLTIMTSDIHRGRTAEAIETLEVAIRRVVARAAHGELGGGVPNPRGYPWG